MIPLSEDAIPNRLEITLKNGEPSLIYFFEGGQSLKLSDLNPAEMDLFKTHAQQVQLKGMWYQMDKDYPRAWADDEKTLVERMNYTAFAWN